MGFEDVILAAIVKEIVEKVKGSKQLKAMIRKAIDNDKFRKAKGKREVNHEV